VSGKNVARSTYEPLLRILKIYGGIHKTFAISMASGKGNFGGRRCFCSSVAVGR
jgi:hypothetical protein